MTWEISVIVILLLLILILWIYSHNYSFGAQNEDSTTNVLIDNLRKKIYQIYNQSTLKNTVIDQKMKALQIRPLDSGKTHIEDKKYIWLVVKSPQNNKRYAESFLLKVLIHEIAHLCNTTHVHDRNFYRLESELIRSAKKLNCIDDNWDPDYPCVVDSP